jgi:nicotinamidase-related amidase
MKPSKEMEMDARWKFSRDRTGLLIVDIQERLAAAMDQTALARMIRRTQALIEGAKAFELPVVVTEQYPKGLGSTISPIRSSLGDVVKPIEKIEFTAAVPVVLKALRGRGQIIVCGMETHVCVFQTVRDLAAKEYVPYVCADAVLSRFEEDRRVGLDLCRDVGGVVGTVESVLFDVLGSAGTPEFKKISAAVKQG